MNRNLKAHLITIAILAALFGGLVLCGFFPNIAVSVLAIFGIGVGSGFLALTYYMIFEAIREFFLVKEFERKYQNASSK